MGSRQRTVAKCGVPLWENLILITTRCYHNFYANDQYLQIILINKPNNTLRRFGFYRQCFV
jgi:hypothetical protein